MKQISWNFFSLSFSPPCPSEPALSKLFPLVGIWEIFPSPWQETRFPDNLNLDQIIIIIRDVRIIRRIYLLEEEIIRALRNDNCWLKIFENFGNKDSLPPVLAAALSPPPKKFPP